MQLRIYRHPSGFIVADVGEEVVIEYNDPRFESLHRGAKALFHSMQEQFPQGVVMAGRSAKNYYRLAGDERLVGAIVSECSVSKERDPTANWVWETYDSNPAASGRGCLGI